MNFTLENVQFEESLNQIKTDEDIKWRHQEKGNSASPLLAHI